MAQSQFDQANKLLGHILVPKSVDPTLTLIPTVETPTNLQDQTSGTPTEAADDVKSKAAAMAARLAANTCSVEMFSLVISSLASEAQNQLAPDAKRPKLDPSISAPASYLPQPVAPPLPQSQPEPVPPPPPFSPSPRKEDGTSPALPPVTIPLQPVMMPMPGGVVPFAYGSLGPSPPFPLPDYTVLAQAPFVGGPSPYQGLHGPAEGGLFGAPPVPFAPTPPPLSRP